MYKIAILILGLVIAGTSLYAAARDGDGEHLASCEAELQQMYGESTGVKLKSLSHKRGGTFLRLKVKPADSTGHRVTCQVDKTGAISLTDAQGVALVDPQYDAAGQVSLAD